MSTPHTAFKAAQKIIQEAKERGSTKINLSSPDTRALNSLPEEIKDIPNLKTINLSSTDISDDSLQVISSISSLRTIMLSYTKVTNKTLVMISSLPELQKLNLGQTNINDEGLAILRYCQGLTDVSIFRTAVSDVGAGFLGEMKQLQSISAFRTNLTGIGVSKIASIPGLRELRISGTLVDDLGAYSLSEAKNLEFLELANTEISDRSLAMLTGLSRLKRLWIAGTKVTDSSMESIAHLLDLQNLNVEGTSVTEKKLSQISSLPNLRRLNIVKTQVADLRPLLDFPALPTGIIEYHHTPATSRDLILDYLSRLGNSKERTEKTLIYLRDAGENWPPAPEFGTPHIEGVPPIPISRLSPLQVEFREGMLRRSLDLGDRFQSTEADSRAREGWEAMRDFLDDIRATQHGANHPNLDRALSAFDRALGRRYDDMRAIAVGIHGSRIVRIASKADDFLFGDAAADLQALASMVETYLNRFSQWSKYLDDMSPVSPNVVSEHRASFEVIASELSSVDWVEDDVAEEYRSQLVASQDAPNDSLLATGLVASTRSVLSAIARFALDSAVSTRNGLVVLGKDIKDEAYDGFVKVAAKGALATGVVSVAAVGAVFVNNGSLLKTLASVFPEQLGWVNRVLQFLGVM